LEESENFEEENQSQVTDHASAETTETIDEQPLTNKQLSEKRGNYSKVMDMMKKD